VYFCNFIQILLGLHVETELKYYIFSCLLVYFLNIAFGFEFAYHQRPIYGWCPLREALTKFRSWFSAPSIPCTQNTIFVLNIFINVLSFYCIRKTVLSRVWNTIIRIAFYWFEFPGATLIISDTLLGRYIYVIRDFFHHSIKSFKAFYMLLYMESFFK